MKRLLLEGGGGAKGAFLRAGPVDEISLIFFPTADGANGACSTSLVPRRRLPRPAVVQRRVRRMEGDNTPAGRLMRAVLPQNIHWVGVHFRAKLNPLTTLSGFNMSVPLVVLYEAAWPSTSPVMRSILPSKTEEAADLWK